MWLCRRSSRKTHLQQNCWQMSGRYLSVKVRLSSLNNDMYREITKFVYFTSTKWTFSRRPEMRQALETHWSGRQLKFQKIVAVSDKHHLFIICWWNNVKGNLQCGPAPCTTKRFVYLLHWSSTAWGDLLPDRPEIHLRPPKYSLVPH